MKRRGEGCEIETEFDIFQGWFERSGIIITVGFLAPLDREPWRDGGVEDLQKTARPNIISAGLNHIW